MELGEFFLGKLNQDSIEIRVEKKKSENWNML